MQLDTSTNALGATAAGGVERAASGAASAKDVGELREAALAFESLFTQMMLQSMRATEFGDDLTGHDGGQVGQEHHEGEGGRYSREGCTGITACTDHDSRNQRTQEGQHCYYRKKSTSVAHSIPLIPRVSFFFPRV